MLLDIQGVTKRFGEDAPVLSDLSLQVKQGEFLSLLGASGCGKSTLLRLISGLEKPSGGDIALQAGAEVGFVFQEPTLLPWANVQDNVYWPLKVRGIGRKEARDRCEAVLEMVGLQDSASKMPGELSGGMKMRVSLARALVTNPNLLLMDEPFGALDEITRNRLNEDLLRLQQDNGWTLVFVTHSVFEAVFLSDRVAIMQAGPGRIYQMHAVEGPEQRNRAFRQSESYTRQCQQVSVLLEAAMQA
ncbi:ABC transporter ATP-binding protein [Polycladidibacter hongkongensis]|uniref:ABC transporter ATP-binding protein n=1 Tax=Polycladidibacter hongkongensis TaxID=1647556 RepID=UPI00083426C7|nr:ABC transporter ATP-binding protein [Pseudovibrio hongkongensis]